MSKQLFLISCFIFLSGCVTPQSSAPTLYDLGTTTAPIMQPEKSNQVTSILVTPVISPQWLDKPAIHYRLAYSNPAKLYAYANSRWAASPAILLTQQMRQHISTGTPYFVIKNSAYARADYVLQIELVEFIQIFDLVDRSHVTVRLQASLIDRKSRALIQQKRFEAQLATPTADAAGAVSAFSKASQQLMQQIVNWTAFSPMQP